MSALARAKVRLILLRPSFSFSGGALRRGAPAGAGRRIHPAPPAFHPGQCAGRLPVLAGAAVGDCRHCCHCPHRRCCCWCHHRCCCCCYRGGRGGGGGRGRAGLFARWLCCTSSESGGRRRCSRCCFGGVAGRTAASTSCSRYDGRRQLLSWRWSSRPAGTCRRALWSARPSGRSKRWWQREDVAARFYKVHVQRH